MTERPLLYPFTPEDLREIAEVSTDVIETTIRVWTSEAAQDHEEGRHPTRHPWCFDCEYRELYSDESIAADVDNQPDAFARMVERTVLDRARRWRILNGRPPSPPPAPSASLVDELLYRDELADIASAEPLIEGVLTRNAYAILRGRDGTYKSITAIDWACNLATGRRWQGRRTERVRVLYIVGEGAYDLDNRITAWETAWGVEVDREWLVTLPRGTDLHSGKELAELLEIVSDFGLVIIDTLRRVSGRADGNGSEMGVVIDNIEKIKRATDDGSVLVLAHTDKGDNDTRGFSGIEDDADIVWHAKKVDGIVVLELTKMRSGPDGLKVSLKPTLTADSVILHTTAEILSGEVETSDAQRVILNALSTTFLSTDGATATELIDVTGMPRSTFYQARGALLNHGLILSNGAKRGARYALPQSNGVQSPLNPLTSTSPASPTSSNGSGPSLSSPTPLRGLDVGLTATDKSIEKESA